MYTWPRGFKSVRRCLPRGWICLRGTRGLHEGGNHPVKPPWFHEINPHIMSRGIMRKTRPRDATCYLCARLATHIRARLCGCIKILRAPRHGDDRVFSRKIFPRASLTTRRKLRKLRVRKGACADARTHFIIFALTAPWQTSREIFTLSKYDPLKYEKYLYLYLHETYRDVRIFIRYKSLGYRYINFRDSRCKHGRDKYARMKN